MTEKIEKKTRQEQLMEGVAKVLESQNFKTFLLFSSKFRDYSFGNTILIWAQASDATRVAGFKTWLSLGRHVKKGEKGIKIFAPFKFNKKKEKVADDSDVEEFTAENAANQQPEKKQNYIKFRPVYVFDVSQTEGAVLPMLKIGKPVAIGVEAEAILDRILKASPVPIGYEDLKEGHKGYYLPSEKRIVLSTALTPVEKCKTLLHELAHHFDEKNKNDVDRQIGKSMREVVAEGAAYLACASLGIDSSEYSCVYLANWGQDYKKILAAGDSIRKLGGRLMELVGAEGFLKEESKAA